MQDTDPGHVYENQEIWTVNKPQEMIQTPSRPTFKDAHRYASK